MTDTGHSKVYHTPVMLSEVVEALKIVPAGVYVDCTVGEGGHAQAILSAGAQNCRLLGLDPDPEAIEVAKRRLEYFHNRVVLLQDSYVRLGELAQSSNFNKVDGVLMDLGMSSLQVEKSTRGFSFMREGSLDMRFNPDHTVTANNVVNEYTVGRLIRLISTLGNEPLARRIGRQIVKERPIRSTTELSRVIESATGKRRGRLNPSTKTFQAIRMEVNQELDVLSTGLAEAMELLNTNGRLVIISYESLTDKIVKDFIRREASACICPPEIPECRCNHSKRLRIITKKPLTPSTEEVQHNPRSRSARMRVAERF